MHSSSKIFLLIDANALIHRAFHALPMMTSNEQKPTNAVYGFAAMLIKVLQELQPAYVAAAFDLAAPTFRDELFADYKATRVRGPNELYDQIPMVKEMLKKIGIPVLEKEGFEADDIIGTMAKEFEKKYPDVAIIVLTGDLDTLQLVDQNISVLTLKKGISETMIYDEKAVTKRFGFKPQFVSDFKGLKGDPSDNISGVKGVGEKTAAAIIKQFSSLEEFYKYLDVHPKLTSLELKDAKVGERTLESLRVGRETAFFSKMLASIRFDVPVEVLAKDLEFSFDREHIASVLQEFGFKSLVHRIIENSGVRSAAADLIKPPGVPKEILLNEKNIVQFVQAVRKHNKLFFVFENDVYMFGAIVANGVSMFVLTKGDFQRSELLDLFRDENIRMIGFNVNKIPRAVQVANKIFDLKIAGWLFNSDDKKVTLEKLARRFLHQEYHFDLLAKLADTIETQLKEHDLFDVFVRIEMPLVSVLRDVEKNGFWVEKPKLEALKKELEAIIPKFEKEIYQLAGKSFNINSPKALRELLFTDLEISAKGIRKTPSGVISTDSDELEKIRKIHPIIEKVLQYRELQKILTTYTVSLFKYIEPHTSRIYPTFLQTGTATGRLSCETPNLQNIPAKGIWAEKIRTAFRADKNFTLAAFDYSQLELRIAADFSKDPVMIDAFIVGEDIHKRTAAQVQNIPINEVTAEMRFRAKALNFGLIYGMGPKAFSEATGLSMSEAKLFIQKYFDNFQGIRKMIEKFKEQACEQGYVETPTGRKRFLPEIVAGGFRERAAAERMAVNMPIQGFEADLIKLAMIQIKNHYEEKKNWNENVRMILQVHDELIFEINKAIIKEVMQEIKKIMEGVWKLAVPLVVEMKTGENWWEITK